MYGGQRNNIHHNIAWNNNAFIELGQSSSADNTIAYNLVMAAIPYAMFLVTEGAEGNRGPIMRTKVHNNTVYLSDPSSIGINCDGGCTGDILTLKNNIIWSEGRIGYIDRQSDEGHNVYWKANGAPAIFFPNPGDFSPTSKIADPHFVKPSVGAGNFRLKPVSPAIDAGKIDPIHNEYATDLGETKIFQGTSVDIGAYEHQP